MVAEQEDAHNAEDVEKSVGLPGAAGVAFAAGADSWERDSHCPAGCGWALQGGQNASTRSD